MALPNERSSGPVRAFVHHSRAASVLDFFRHPQRRDFLSGIHAASVLAARGRWVRARRVRHILRGVLLGPAAAAIFVL